MSSCTGPMVNYIAHLKCRKVWKSSRHIPQVRNFDSVIYTFEFDLTKVSAHVNFRFSNVVTNDPLTILQHTLTC